MTERTIFEENITDINLQNTGDKKIIETSNVWQQALSFLMGWIPTSRKWTPILSDTDGRLLVSTSPTKSNEANHSNVTVDATSGTLLNENADRKLAIIQNPLSETVYLHFGDAAATTDDFQLLAGQTYLDDVFYGKITGIVAGAGGDLVIVELT